MQSKICVAIVNLEENCKKAPPIQLIRLYHILVVMSRVTIICPKICAGLQKLVVTIDITAEI